MFIDNACICKQDGIGIAMVSAYKMNADEVHLKGGEL